MEDVGRSSSGTVAPSGASLLFFPVYSCRTCLLSALLAIFLLCAALSGCAVRSSMPAEKTLAGGDITREIENTLQHGDWLVTRGVHGTDDFVATMTNMPLSHAAVYDAVTRNVIEAEAEGVHATPLPDFIAKSQRLLVLQPMWGTPHNRPLAVLRAASRIGKPYNFTGLMGLNTPGSYYCTQLCLDAYRPYMQEKPDNPVPLVIKPGQMYHWGRIAYDSGP